MPQLSFFIALVFLLVLIVNVIANLVENFPLIVVSKVLLVPLIEMFLWITVYGVFRKSKKGRKWIILFSIALVFALLGDILLLFDDDNDTIFLLGAASFFIFQIILIVIFIRFFQKHSLFWPFAIFYLIFTTLFLYALSKELAISLLIVITIYVVSVACMASLASSLGWIVALGGFCFAVSDTILGTKKFLEYDWLPEDNIMNAFVMVFYGLALLIITLGFSTLYNRLYSRGMNHPDVNMMKLV